VKTVQANPKGIAGIIRMVVKYGTITEINDGIRMVTLDLAGLSYRFHIPTQPEADFTPPLAYLCSFALAVEGVTYDPCTITDDGHGPVPVPADAARHLVYRFATHGQCLHCRHGQHQSCLVGSEQGPCRCVCVEEWLAVRVAQEAESVVTVPGAVPMEPVLAPEPPTDRPLAATPADSIHLGRASIPTPAER
jgi:hypothetical protein